MKKVTIAQSRSNPDKAQADQLRKDLKEKKVLYLDLMSSPGAGKTSFLKALLPRLQKQDFACGIMEADFDSSLDADVFDRAGFRTVQLLPPNADPLDCCQSRQGLDALGLEGLDMVFLENVGSLVRGVDLDSGAHADILVFSIPEGEDKPQKYPLMFQNSDLLILNKWDVREAFDFDADRFKAMVRILNPRMKIIETSVRTELGLDEAAKWIMQRYASLCQSD